MFTPETLDFLSTNRFMNSREWYAEHKGEYKAHVLQPLVEMTEHLAPTLEEIDAQILTEPKVDVTISRIYRDMRRAKGDFYRDYMWLTFKRDKHRFPRYPEFFFVLSPTGFFWGCGHYAAAAETTACMHEMILGNDPLFCKADRALRRQHDYHLDGETYKRSRFPGATDTQRDWLERKTICLMHDGDPITDLFRADLAETIAESFRAMKPGYAFFLAATQKAHELRTDN